MTTYSTSSGDHAVWNQVQAEPDGMEYVPEQQYDLESQHILSDVISDLEDGRLAGGQGGEPGGEGGESWEGGGVCVAHGEKYCTTQHHTPENPPERIKTKIVCMNVCNRIKKA